MDGAGRLDQPGDGGRPDPLRTGSGAEQRAIDHAQYFSRFSSRTPRELVLLVALSHVGAADISEYRTGTEHITRGGSLWTRDVAAIGLCVDRSWAAGPQNRAAHGSHAPVFDAHAGHGDLVWRVHMATGVKRRRFGQSTGVRRRFGRDPARR